MSGLGCAGPEGGQGRTPRALESRVPAAVGVRTLARAFSCLSRVLYHFSVGVRHELVRGHGSSPCTMLVLEYVLYIYYP